MSFSDSEIIQYTAQALNLHQEQIDAWDPINNDADFQLLVSRLGPKIGSLGNRHRCTIDLGVRRRVSVVVECECDDFEALKRHLVLQTASLLSY